MVLQDGQPIDGAQKRNGARGGQETRRRELAQSWLARLEPPSCISNSFEDAHHLVEQYSIDWSSLPELCDPLAGARSVKGRGARPQDEKRFQRKRRQVEAFAAILNKLLSDGTIHSGAVVVDFGCGSGNLLLPLAAVFSSLLFVGVDLRRQDIQILKNRIETSAMKNASGWQGSIRDYDAQGLALDVAIGLHVCGEASDHIIEAAVGRRVPWVLSPCCIGTMNRRPDEGGFIGEIPMEDGSNFVVDKREDGSAVVDLGTKEIRIFGAQRVHENGAMGHVLVSFKSGHGFQSTNTKLHHFSQEIPLLEHLLRGCGRQSFVARKDIALMECSQEQLERPRSSWLFDQLGREDFEELAKIADAGHIATDRHASYIYHSKTIVTMDRSMWACERGYRVSFNRIRGMEQYAKDDLVIGVLMDSNPLP